MRLEQCFVDQATTAPAAPAVVAGNDSRTYGQLHEQAAKLAGALSQTGADRADLARVGVFYDRGPDAYAAVLAVLLVGATYVPINPHHPVGRIRRTVELADLDVIVADRAGLAALEALAAEMPLPPVIAPGEPQGGIVAVGRQSIANADHIYQATAEHCSADDLAYLLFTSGSTGDPKGVPITHGNAMSFLTENAEYYDFGPQDRCSQTFDLTFDLSVFDLFMTWQAGACLYPLPQAAMLAPVDFVTQNKLSVWFSVPAVVALLIKRGSMATEAMPTLRHSLFCGEALTVDVAKAWAAAAPNSTVENLYGPTELTIACSRYRWTEHTESQTMNGVVPIGAPFPSMEAIIIDNSDSLVEAGQEGELCLTGPQQFNGYWRNEAKTADRFLTVAGRRYYRTGDRVVKRDDVLHFVGRVDNQVQVLGHRVELGEVEAAIRTIPEVVDVVAFGLPHGAASVTHLGAAVTLADGSISNERVLRRAAAERLAPYMRPRTVKICDRFPLNANGKIDRQAIAANLEPVTAG
ncbi:MAG: amino acid adenylation domain-containing protein [Acidimicrobiales bacterium]